MTAKYPECCWKSKKVLSLIQKIKSLRREEKKREIAEREREREKERKREREREREKERERDRRERERS